MSGRHRKPTTSSFSVAKIAVTGAVIGGGAVGLAAQAQAASDSEWDVVASCESSGNWAINTGNGYQGGLQFSPSTWLGYGGGQFASAAHYASRDQQIAIAEKVLAGQGRGAWPVCGRGLSGPTPRDVSVKAAKPATTTPPAAAATPAEAPSTVTPLDNPLPEVPLVPQDAPADLAPAATADAPAATPAPESPADPAQELPSQDLPSQDLPAAPESPESQELPVQEAPKPQIISISQTETDSETTIIEASLIGPATMAPADPADPADPAVPPVVPTTPAPAVPAADTVVASAALPDGVSHLPSPDSPPPGTSTDPAAPGANQNVSYLKDLWHAVQNQEIDRNDLLLALAQRSFTGPIPAGDATPAPAPIDAPPTA